MNKQGKGVPAEAFRAFKKKYPRAFCTTLYISGIKQDKMLERAQKDEKSWQNFKKCVKYVSMRLYVSTTPQLRDMGIGTDLYMSAEQRKEWITWFWTLTERLPEQAKLKQIAEKMFQDPEDRKKLEHFISLQEKYTGETPF